jgi:cell wall-associated NlpC family hydrolase
MHPIRGATAAVLLSLVAACAPTVPAEPAPAPGPELPSFLPDTLSAIRADWAPDRRVARFDVEASREGDRLVLTGATDQPAAMERLARALSGHGVAWEDRIQRLPTPVVAATPWALVRNSVANIRSEPSHPAQLATQAPLGTPLRVLDRDGGWLLVQLPDGYIGWVDGGGVEPIDARALAAHRAAEKVVYLETEGLARAAPRPDAPPVSDLVAGAILVRTGTEAGHYRVRFPDGRAAYVPESDATVYGDWAADVEATESSLVSWGLKLRGRPYLWGGTSPKGMDCSGFTKTVYLMNGLLLPRDASQQVHAGVQVDDAGDFDALRPGDLLFFGRPATADRPARVVHVGMWIGDGRFIHSSGRVHVSGVDPADPAYDEYNVGRYLQSRRMIGSVPGVGRLRDEVLYPAGGRFAPAATSGPAARRAPRHVP